MSNIERRLRAVDKFLKEAPAIGHEHFRRVTPIDTGNARANTNLNGNEIRGDYDYSGKLQSGHSSQAPGGMRDPMIEHLRAEFKKI